jgi:hypothetical protein
MPFSDTFAERLLKGRLGEAIFELMFREDEQYDVIPLGYERITPELAQYQHHAQVKAVIDNIRNLPDFILVSKDKASIYLVEVKYRAEYHPQ